MLSISEGLDVEDASITGEFSISSVKVEIVPTIEPVAEVVVAVDDDTFSLTSLISTLGAVGTKKLSFREVLD